MNLDDAIILETFPNRIEAEMAAGLLESEGVTAMVMADDAGGAALGFMGPRPTKNLRIKGKVAARQCDEKK